MKTLLFVAMLIPWAAAAQQSEWQLAQYEDGSYHQEGGLVTVWPMDAELYDKNRCVGREDSGPSTCLFESQEPFSTLVTVAYDDLPLERKFMAPVDFRSNEAGKVKPEKRPEPEPKPKDKGHVGMIVKGGLGTLGALAALGTGAVVLRGRKA